jgi:acylphosphatase
VETKGVKRREEKAMTARVLISGFVQGVRYRKFVDRKAKEFGLKGWVKNLPDSRVEALFTGPKETIERIVPELWKGPFLAEVKAVDIQWSDREGEHEEFIIVRE